MIEGGDRRGLFDPAELDELLQDEADLLARDTRVHAAAARPESRPDAAQPQYRLNQRGKVVLLALPLLLIALIGWFTRDGEPFTLEGVDDGAVLSAEQADELQLQVAFDKAADPATVSATLGGTEIPVTLSDDRLTAIVSASGIPEGENELTVSLARSFPFGSSHVSRTFVVDRTPPTMTVLAPTEPARVTEAVTLRLQVDDPDATVSIDGEEYSLSDGVAEKPYNRPPAAPVEVTLSDPAGNVAVIPVDVPLALAGEPGQAPIRGVHASGWTWATPELRDPILQMVEEGLINTVQLDLKDEGGDVWYDTRVSLAHEVGAVTELWDLRQVVEDLHALDVRVVGRIVIFRDPKLATHAVAEGNMTWVVQNPDGSAYGKYGGFTNPYNEDVWEYNIALAEEAAELGVDDIMYDYVRRPDDYIENMLFPGQDRDPREAIIDFLDVSQQRVHAAGARLAAAVFGIAECLPEGT